MGFRHRDFGLSVVSAIGFRFWHLLKVIHGCRVAGAKVFEVPGQFLQEQFVVFHKVLQGTQISNLSCMGILQVRAGSLQRVHLLPFGHGAVV